VAVWLPAAPGVQADLIEESPDTYFRLPYVGASGWLGQLAANDSKVILRPLAICSARSLNKRLDD
jgi:hypothetical protein